MKKLIALTICAVMALSFAAYANNTPAKDNSQKQSIGKDVEIPNPWVDCKTIADAEKLAGVTLTLPKMIPEGFTQKSIETKKDGIVQIIYENGENEIIFRQSKASDDISGDYTEYKENSTLTVGALKVTAKGNSGKVNVATWANGGYSFAILANLGGKGLDTQAITDMVSSSTNGPSMSDIEIPNPFIHFKTLEKAQKMAGFTVTLPRKMPKGYTQKSIEAIKNKMLQVVFEKGKNGFVIRKAKGSDNISGDYNKYSENKRLTMGKLHVSTKGNNGKVNVAIWVDGRYTYAVTISSHKTGFDDSVIRGMISGIR